MWSDTISLKFNSQDQWLELGLENSHTFDAIEIGVIPRADGTQSMEWHVDCRYVGDMPEALQPFVINPTTKRHEYAK